MDRLDGYSAQEPASALPAGALVNLDAILSEIAARLVIPSAQTPWSAGPASAEETDYIQIMVFRLGNLHFGLDILHVREVIRGPQVTPVPGLPGWLLGVANFHGEIISIVHLPLFLGVEAPLPMTDLTVMVAHAADQQIGLVVGEVETIYTTAAAAIISPEFKIDPAVVPYLRGAVERDGEFIRLLHGERLLLGGQMQQFS